MNNYKYYQYDNIDIEIQVKSDEASGDWLAVAYATRNGKVITTQRGITENQALDNVNRYLVEELHINIR